MKIGRPVESLNWMSLITIMSLNQQNNIDDILVKCQWYDEEDLLYQNKSSNYLDLMQELPYSSLIDRVLLSEIKSGDYDKHHRLRTLRSD